MTALLDGTMSGAVVRHVVDASFAR